MVMKVYSPEFKADAVALYLSDPSHTFEGIGKDLGISRETLRNWVRAERARRGGGSTTSTSTAAWYAPVAVQASCRPGARAPASPTVHSSDHAAPRSGS